MSEQQNPHQASEADLIVAPEGGEGAVLEQPNKRPISDGWTWFADAWTLFKQAPGLWIGMSLVFMLIIIALSFVPFVSIAVNLLLPIFTAGLMLGCHELKRGGQLEFSHLFAGFSQNVGQLVIVGLLYMVLMTIAVIPGMVVLFIGIFAGIGLEGMAADGELDFSSVNLMIMSIGFLLMMALMIPVAMAYWFAPTLIVLNDMQVFEAMALSFKGCLRNILPFLWYGVVMLLLSVLAIIPLGLGYLIFCPVMMISIYTGYRAIFIDP